MEETWSPVHEGRNEGGWREGEPVGSEEEGEGNMWTDSRQGGVGWGDEQDGVGVTRIGLHLGEVVGTYHQTRASQRPPPARKAPSLALRGTSLHRKCTQSCLSAVGRRGMRPFGSWNEGVPRREALREGTTGSVVCGGGGLHGAWVAACGGDVTAAGVVGGAGRVRGRAC